MAETFASVWDAIEDDPAVAENLRLRSSLMIALKRSLKDRKLTRAEAASLLGVTKPRFSEFMLGKTDLFPLETLVDMAVAAGLRIEMRISDAA